jgi:rubrerythrin
MIKFLHFLRAWVCPTCGTTNERGNKCSHCGTGKP